VFELEIIFIVVIKYINININIFMSESFLGEIKTVAFNRIPYGWLKCDGQFIQIYENTALFSLLGTTYGGDGKTNFRLPNLNTSSYTPIIKSVVPSQNITFTILHSTPITNI